MRWETCVGSDTIDQPNARKCSFPIEKRGQMQCVPTHLHGNSWLERREKPPPFWSRKDTCSLKLKAQAFLSLPSLSIAVIKFSSYRSCNEPKILSPCQTWPADYTQQRKWRLMRGAKDTQPANTVAGGVYDASSELLSVSNVSLTAQSQTF